MNQEDLKAISGLLDKKLDEKLNPIKTDLVEIKESVEANTASVMNLESEIKAYSDALDIERKRIGKHDASLEVIEERLGLEKV